MFSFTISKEKKEKIIFEFLNAFKEKIMRNVIHSLNDMKSVLVNLMTQVILEEIRIENVVYDPQGLDDSNWRGTEEKLRTLKRRIASRLEDVLSQQVVSAIGRIEKMTKVNDSEG
jgi:hypothetical protein